MDGWIIIPKTPVPLNGTIGLKIGPVERDHFAENGPVERDQIHQEFGPVERDHLGYPLVVVCICSLLHNLVDYDLYWRPINSLSHCSN